MSTIVAKEMLKLDQLLHNDPTFLTLKFSDSFELIKPNFTPDPTIIMSAYYIMRTLPTIIDADILIGVRCIPKGEQLQKGDISIWHYVNESSQEEEAPILERFLTKGKLFEPKQDSAKSKISDVRYVYYPQTTEEAVEFIIFCLEPLTRI